MKLTRVKSLLIQGLEEDDMLDDTQDRTDVKTTLGRYLASIRADRKLTLRQVEEATNKKVSNAYLSQIETDKIQKPSPNILYVLADLYGISYENLMERAGYITPTADRPKHKKHGRVPTFAEHHLTPQEEEELLAYLEHLRRRKRPGDKS